MAYKIVGKWYEGKALEDSTISSNYLGEHNGEAIFDTKRNEMAEALKKLKYDNDESEAYKLIDRACEYLKNAWDIVEEVDLIVSTPSSKERYVQPVDYLVENIGSKLNIPIEKKLLKKITQEEVKDLPKEKKRSSLKGAITQIKKVEKESNILLIDDLYSTGSTLNACVDALEDDKNIKKIFVLCMTKNRKR